MEDERYDNRSDMHSARNPRKSKRSFTLSPNSVDLLDEIRKERRAASVSAVLEEILQRVRLQRERKRLDAAVTSYYDSLSGADRAEDAAWGDFVLREMAEANEK